MPGPPEACVLHACGRTYLVDKLDTGKWIFLWVVLAEGASLIVAMVMRCMGELEGRWGPQWTFLPHCCALQSLDTVHAVVSVLPPHSCELNVRGQGHPACDHMHLPAQSEALQYA